MSKETEKTLEDFYTDSRNYADTAGLPKDFDAEISKLQVRDTAQKEHLHAALKELGQRLDPHVAELLGRKPKTVDVITSGDLKAGEIKKSAAFFFVDSVEGGSLIYMPADLASKGKSFSAERGRMLVVQAGRYVLTAVRSRTRAVIVFS
jgi:hypothetical protein